MAASEFKLEGDLLTITDAKTKSFIRFSESRQWTRSRRTSADAVVNINKYERRRLSGLPPFFVF